MNWFFNSSDEGSSLIYKGWSVQTVGYVLLGTVVLLAIAWLLQKGKSRRWLRSLCAVMRIVVVLLL